MIRLKPQSEGGLVRNPYKLNKGNRGVSGNVAFQLADLEFGIGFKARLRGLGRTRVFRVVYPSRWVAKGVAARQ